MNRVEFFNRNSADIGIIIELVSLQERCPLREGHPLFPFLPHVRNGGLLLDKLNWLNDNLNLEFNGRSASIRIEVP